MSGLLLAFSLTFSPLQSPAQEKVPEGPPEWLIWNVVQWLPLVERWHPDFPELDPAWVLAIIAQESQGFPYLEGPEGENSIGLMQIISRSWTGTKEQLKRPATNIYVGMRMLSAIILQTDGDLRQALGAYNCGFVGLDAGRCGRYGGYAYADRVIDYWVPVFRMRLAGEAITPDRVGDWLATLGYRWGLGQWYKQEEQYRRLLRLIWGHPIRME
jgi:hypothetical protein